MKTAEVSPCSMISRLYSRHGWFNSVPGNQRFDQVAAFHGVDKLTF
jgi:hypothetical protein